MSWVKVENMKGGQVVVCGLCGRKVCRETFWAEDTNYAEAFRLATAYAWHHEHSEPHRAALQAFHAEELPPIPEDEVLLYEVFGKPIPDERALRRRHAQDVAVRTMYDAKRATQQGPS